MLLFKSNKWFTFSNGEWFLKVLFSPLCQPTNHPPNPGRYALLPT